jgi:predicted nucleic acid-binding protein
LIYVDSCAVVKLLREEQHSAALAAHLGTSATEMISSELTKVEVCRTLIRLRIRERTRDHADDMLSRVAKLPINAVLDIAADLDGPTLRSLDALHVATARMLGPAVTEFITYDKRLAEAATDAGLPLTMPGVN